MAITSRLCARSTTWHHFNDNIVTNVPDAQVYGSQAYILLYTMCTSAQQQLSSLPLPLVHTTSDKQPLYTVTAITPCTLVTQRQVGAAGQASEQEHQSVLPPPTATAAHVQSADLLAPPPLTSRPRTPRAQSQTTAATLHVLPQQLRSQRGGDVFVHDGRTHYFRRLISNNTMRTYCCSLIGQCKGWK